MHNFVNFCVYFLAQNCHNSSPAHPRKSKNRKSVQQPTMQVEAVAPGLSTNPSNVLVVESVLPPATFQAFFPRAHSAYTYTNFLRAVAKFPAVCTQADVCRWG